MKTLQDKLDAETQRIGTKDQEITDLNNQIKDMKGMLQRADSLVANQKGTILRLEAPSATHQRDRTDLDSEQYKEAGKASHLSRGRTTSEPNSGPPIMNKEKQTLAAGIANRLLNDLRRELAHTQEEKADLLKSIVAENRDLAQEDLFRSAKCSATEFCHQILKHMEPLHSIMQYHRVCGGLHLLLSHLPPLRTGCSLEFSQIEALWNRADAAAKDTLAFMWCINDLKVPVGAMETLSGSPPFYVKRYILRCITLLSQHHNMVPTPRETLPTLRSYSHSQYHAVRDFQRSHPQCFDQALAILATAETTICYEAVQHYQTLINEHPAETWQPTLTHLKNFVTKTLDEQHTTLTNRRFGTISSSTLLLKPKDHIIESKMAKESIGTCFL